MNRNISLEKENPAIYVFNHLSKEAVPADIMWNNCVLNNLSIELYPLPSVSSTVYKYYNIEEEQKGNAVG